MAVGNPVISGGRPACGPQLVRRRPTDAGRPAEADEGDLRRVDDARHRFRPSVADVGDGDGWRSELSTFPTLGRVRIELATMVLLEQESGRGRGGGRPQDRRRQNTSAKDRRETPCSPRCLHNRRQGFGWARWSRGWLYQTLKLFNGYRVVRPAPKGAPAG